MFDFRTIEYFKMIAQSASITEAAQKLYISQPSLSKFLSQLEVRLNTKLVNRSVTPHVLTLAGTRFLEYLDADVCLYEQYMSEIAATDFSPVRKIRFGVGPATGALIIETVLPQFHKEYPDIEIEVYEEVHTMLTKMLAAKQLDLALIVHTDEDRKNTFNRASETVIRQPRLFMVSKEHPLASLVEHPDENSPKTPQLLAPHSLAGYRIITGKQGQHIHEDLLAFQKKYSIYPLDLIQSLNLFSNVALAAHNFAINVAPRMYIQQSPLVNSMFYFYCEDALMQWSLEAECQTASPSQAEKRLVQIIKEAYTEIQKMMDTI